uniref:Bgt_avrF2_8 n=1 Tax=Blumeria graminis f. sp. tritici 96224 TaxID=1268274 RepID=A0A381L0H7_BLUGR
MKKFGFISFVSLLFHLMPVFASENYICGGLRIEGSLIEQEVQKKHSLCLKSKQSSFNEYQHFEYAYFFVQSCEPVRVSFDVIKIILSVESDMNGSYSECIPEPSEQ